MAPRQRRKKTSGATSGPSQDAGSKQKSEATNGTSSDTGGATADDSDANEAEETLWQTFSSHPLVRVAALTLVPYWLFLGFYYLQLEHPEYISIATAGLVSLRPAVGIHDERQLLILGSPSSGTVQIQTELKSKLGLEIGHETTDSSWHFVRDGTVSWFHGIRFLPPLESKEQNVKTFNAICGSGEHMNMGFHPASYRKPEGKCSFRNKWDDCWKRECFMTLAKEWGCAAQGKCEINFRTNLHQVRNPLRTIESLVVKFCRGGLEGTVADSFIIYASALFPRHDFTGDSCIEAAGYFLVEYQTALVDARRRGEIDAFYRIEESSACDVAELAGFMSANDTVYAPNHGSILSICGEEAADAKKLVEKKENKVNDGLVRLGWQDLRGGKHGSQRKKGSTELEKMVKELFKALGYDAALELEEAPYEDPFSTV